MNKVIVFDVDGTLFDTKKGIIKALNQVLQENNCSLILKVEENKYIGPSIKSSLMKWFKFNEDEAEKLVLLYRQYYVDKYIFDSKPYKNIICVLQKLYENNFILCIATMKTNKQILKLLKIFSLSKYFSVVEAAAEDGSISKSDMLYKIKSKFHNACFYMVGDTEGDYLAAKSQDFIFLYALYGYGKFNTSNIKYIIKTPNDLLKFFL